MKIRSLALIVGLIGSLAPLGASADHCPNPIYIFSTQRYETGIPDPRNPDNTLGGVPSAVSSVVGCTVLYDLVLGPDGEDPILHPATDTDIVYPNSNRMSVRLLDHGSDPSIIASATLTWAGEVYDLVMSQQLSVTGEPAAWLDSQTLQIDPADTVAANNATAHICLVDEVCYERTYRTVVPAV